MTSKLAITKLLEEIEYSPTQTQKILINGLKMSLHLELCPFAKLNCTNYSEFKDQCNTAHKNKQFTMCDTYREAYIQKVTT